MRAAFVVLVSSVFVAGCAISGSGADESISFVPLDTPSAEAVGVFQPYPDLPLTFAFSCPGKVYSAMISPGVPLPPIVPVGFVNRAEAYVRISAPAADGIPLPSIHAALASGQDLRFQETFRFGRPYNAESGVITTLRFPLNCSEFAGAELNIDPFEYLGSSYPAAKVKLMFKSTLKVDGGYWR